MKITNDWLKEQNACSEGILWFVAQTETDGLEVMQKLITADEEEKLRWANWLIVRLMEHDQQIRYAMFSAKKVLSIFEDKYPNDKRPRLAIEAIKKYLADKTKNNRVAARVAGDAAWAAAVDAARAAEEAAAKAAAGAAWDAAWDAAWAAAGAAVDAARAAGDAARAAGDAARAAGATWDAAGDAAYRKMLTDIVDHGIELMGGTK